MLFEGWIPNATGNLSFTAIGDSLKNTNISSVRIRQHFTNGAKRWLVCAQARTNPDPWLWRWVLKLSNRLLNLTRKKSEKKDRFDTLTYVMTGVSGDLKGYEEGKISGIIVILNPKRQIYSESLTLLNSKRAELQKAASHARFNAVSTNTDMFSWLDFENELERLSIFKCRFTLLRNGKCFIEAEKNDVPDYIFKYLVDQCYYYLKDCVHSHYHHDSRTDAILEIVAQKRGSDWRIKVLRNLYRKIIFLRKLHNQHKLSDALGILAYANNFVTLFGNVDYNANGVPTKKSFNTPNSDALEKSITLILEKIKTKREHKTTNVQFILTVVVAVLAAYIVLAQGFPEKSKGKLLYDATNKYLAAHPEILIYAPTVTILIYLIYFSINEGRIDIERSTYKIMAWLNKGYYVAIGASFSIILMLYSYYLLSFSIGVPFLERGQLRPETIFFLKNLLRVLRH